MGLPKKQTTAKPRKKLNTVKTCRGCRKSYRPNTASQAFCNPECKTTRQASDKRKALDASRLERFMTSAFAYWMAGEAQRAGRLEIVKGHTVESLLALYDVYKYYLRANGYGDDNRLYAMAHVHPVKPADGDYIGVLFAENLFVCPELPNKQHGNQYFGYGKCIHRAHTSAANFVSEDESRKSIIRRVVRYLGEDVVVEFAKKAKVQPTRRIKRISHLELFLDELGMTLDELHACSTVKLGKLQAQLAGKEAFVITSSGKDQFGVLIHELQRHAEFRPDGVGELVPLLEQLQELAAANFLSSVEIVPQRVIDKVALYGWKVMHGQQADLDHVRDLLRPYMPL
ncbi:hypothetical protein ID144_23700 [Pseudomonas sp. JM0905a]|uniref:hypothetical protein n=1 Tax=Pseudomonas sp. JM0905a TaxID=2772484 RepID=UPI001686EBE8|nr:hypothetical protein [Pseudomonas sp. JM0905a]MBD2840052.1 hypothetical protein [Pseudomonas sp. JM0905a]